MKMTHRPRTSSLFLLELIFSILFFSVASAICIQIFVRAHTLSRDARALHTAVSACSDAAAEDPASDNDSVFTVAVGFDAELQPCAADADAAAYLLTADFSERGKLLRCKAIMTKKNSSAEIYRLETVHYLSGGTADE